MMISDFKTRIGWLETYISDVQMLLEWKWYEVKSYWRHLPKWRKGRFVKYFGLVWAFINFISMFNIKRAIKEFKPDIIRYHSTLRWVWWLWILASKNFEWKKFVMYHDFWYFYPFPHTLNFVDQVITPLTLRNYLKSANTKNPVKIIAIAFKYLSVYLIKTQLTNNWFKHLTPSDFMAEIAMRSYKIPKKDIQALPHFIQE
jgi:hypothetical protein